jgi:hypothetical protein
MTLSYKCTFGLKESKSTSVTQKQMPSPREQYGSTVHLFIGTRCSPCKITPMPFTFANNSIVIHRGLNSLFPFKSVSFSAITPKLSCEQLWLCTILRILCASSHCGFDLSPKVPVHVSLSHPVLEGKPNANHVRVRISNSRTQKLHNMDIITQCSNSIKKGE